MSRPRLVKVRSTPHYDVFKLAEEIEDEAQPEPQPEREPLSGPAAALLWRFLSMKPRIEVLDKFPV